MAEAVSPKQRILDAAYELLSEGGRDAITTRAVSARAQVQAQTIYRHFDDMSGLLDAVAARGFDEFLEAKAEPDPAGDPVEQLRAGWDLHIAFAVSRPAVYALMYAEPRADTSEGSRRVHAVLRALVLDVAAAGRLVVPVDTAVAMIYAAGIGVALARIMNLGGQEIGPTLSARTRDAILDAVVITDAGDGPPPDLAWHATSMRAALPDGDPRFTAAEAGLLDEWLRRLENDSR